MIHLAFAVLLAASVPATSTGEALFAEARYTAAAAVFEARWAADFDLTALAWAGRSRLRAGQAAHAVTYLTRALAGDLPDPLRRDVQSDLASARARTRPTAVRLELHDPPDRLTVVARRTAADAPALHHDLTPPADTTDHLLVLALDPGEWTLELRHGPDIRATRTVDIQANQPPILLAAPIRPPPPPPPDTPRPTTIRPRLTLAGGIIGGASTLVGIGLLIHAQARISTPAIIDPDGDCFPLNCPLLTLRSVGAGILGGGLGVVAGTLPLLAPTPRTRRIIWASELAIGAAAFAAGLATAGRGGARFNAFEDHLDPNISLRSADLHTLGTSFMGLGIALAATATAGLIADALPKRRNQRASLAPTFTGLTLSGRF